MERLTEKHFKRADGYYMKCSERIGISCEGNCDGCDDFCRIVDRLGTYEDTGLTPEEVKATAVALQMAREENTALTAERDAAVAYLKELSSCTSCKFYDPENDVCVCLAVCTTGESWTWRGVNPDGD